MSSPLFFSNGDENSLMLLQAMNPENEGDLDLNFLVRKDELIPSQPKINSASYDLSLDKRLNKIGSGNKLIKYEFEKLPDYLKKNKNKYEQWLD